MRVLFAVIDELYSFAVSALVRLFTTPAEAPVLSLSDGTSHASGVYNTDIPERVITAVPQVQRESTVRDTDERKDEVSFKAIGTVLEQHGSTAPVLEKNMVMYVGTTATPLWKNPAREFDGVLTKLPYGAMVMLTERRGRWAKIMYREEVGWMFADDLVDRAAHVYPHFIIGEQNDADDPNTIRTRAVIDDALSGGVAEISLQAPEYVLYKLVRKGIVFSWPKEQPRVPGMWHTILKGVTGVHMGLQPKTGSIMEYMINENMGHLAYVEAVFPDETINVSEVNYPDCGIYNERVLTHEEWKELKPVFIQIQ